MGRADPGGQVGLIPAGSRTGRVLAVDPYRPWLVYADGITTDHKGALHRSFDGGVTWTDSPLPEDGPFVQGLAVDPFVTSTVYVGTGGQGVLRSDDYGASFTTANRGLPASVYSITPDTAAPGVFYAVGPGGLYQTVDGAKSWKRARYVENPFVGFVASQSRPKTLHMAEPPGIASFGVASFTVPESCAPADDRLCLFQNRFFVSLQARDFRTGRKGAGLTTPYNDVFGHFGLPDLTGDPQNPEVFVKVLDGRGVNGHFWVFHGSLTDLEYSLTVTDTKIGAIREFSKPFGSTCGGFDDEVFADASSISSIAMGTAGWSSTSGPELTLGGGRFRLTLSARDQRTGRTAPGEALPQNDLYGIFSLPGLTGDPGNPEVFVKVLDGSDLNRHFWVFYGGLTDLEYTVTVEDLTRGSSRGYFKEAGSACGGFDTQAFPR